MPIVEMRKAIAQKADKDNTWKFFVEMGNIAGNEIVARSYDGIKNAWHNEPCYIVGSGYDLRPFIKEIGWNFLDGKHTIGINHVIEDYDGFEWFLFLDKRFLLHTTYDMKKYTGRVFAHCATGLLPDGHTTIFHTGVDGPTSDVKDGLYNGNLSGLVALNLAIISGANPIYLLGCGIAKGASAQSYHYKDDYTEERKEEKIFIKFKRVMRLYNKYAQWNDRIVQVTDGLEPIAITHKIKAIDLIAHTQKEKALTEWTGDEPKIVHVSFSSRLSDHADITRYICQECYGNHYLVSQDEKIPNADLYILEHFLSTDRFVNAFPFKNRAINIVHTVNCIPLPGFNCNIALTNAWKKILEAHFVQNIEMIHGGIDLDKYKGISCNVASMVFGRITRYSSGKIHPEWNRMVEEIFKEVPEARCIMYTQLDRMQGRPTLAHERMHYDNSCNIDMFKGDFLKNLSVYVHCNGSFKETLSFAVIEAMATGLPIVYLDEKTGVLDEVTGNNQIKCTTIDEVKKAIIRLLQDKESRILYGIKSKEQVKKFDKNIMVQRFDKVIKQCLVR